MAEYIFGDRIIAQHKYGGVTVETVKMNAEMRERIVRCRDCKYVAELGHLCLMFAFNLGNGTVIPPDVEPDGFCAWGEPREGGE